MGQAGVGLEREAGKEGRKETGSSQVRHEESRVADGIGRRMEGKGSRKMSDGRSEENGERAREKM